MPSRDSDITRLLHEWRNGSREAENELFALVLPNLKRLARYLMNRERKGHTLQSSDLVNQIYFRLVAAKHQDWQNRQHFFAIAARAMRQYLIDYQRGRPTACLTPLEGFEEFLPASSVKLDIAIQVNRLLEEMAKVQPHWCQLVELKFFLGLTDEETAEVMQMKLRTMQRMWKDARRWLFERGKPSDARGAAAG